MKSFTIIILSLITLLGSLSSAANTVDGTTGDGSTLKSKVLRYLKEREPLTVFVGQDLNAVRGYTNSGLFKRPEGVTTYIGLYGLLDESTAYQGLGMDPEGRLVVKNAAWGGGETSAYRMALENPHAVLALAVSLTEDSVVHSLDGVLDGEFDAEIRHLANFIMTIKNPVFLRLGYEFDGRWNAGYGDSERYKSVFRYIVENLRAHGAATFETVWQASASPIDELLDGKHEEITDWYPGDDVVDWLGLSWFLAPHDKPQGTDLYFRPQNWLADEVVALARLKGKPVMIAEAAPQGFDLDELTRSNISVIWDGYPGKSTQRLSAKKIWDEWYQPLFSYIEQNNDVIKVLAYINADWDSQQMWSSPYGNGYWGDTRIHKNNEISEAWSSFLSK